MTQYSMYTDTIRQSVSALQAAEALGLSPDRNGRCACPVHSGKDRNCRVWPDDRGFYCYVCHAGGDVIDLVRAIQNCSFPEAVAWLNSAFHLALLLDRPMDKNASEAAENARKRKQMERDRKRMIDQALFDCYAAIGRELNRLEADATQYRPTRPYQEWDKRYAEAVKLLPEVRDFVQWLETEVIGS